MTWIATPESSNVAGFDYIDDRQVLVVEFKNGGRYNYFDVPKIVYEQMKAASSKGQFLAQNIKNIGSSGLSVGENGVSIKRRGLFL